MLVDRIIEEKKKRWEAVIASTDLTHISRHHLNTSMIGQTRLHTNYSSMAQAPCRVSLRVLYYLQYFSEEKYRREIVALKSCWYK